MGNKIGRRRQVVDEKYTRPQGLYEHRDIDHKKLRKLILESKLAPCYPGDEESSIDLEECPICFLYYPSLNRSKCCMKGICTECFLQMKPTNSTRPTQCPFCKTPNYAVEYRGMKSKEEKSIEQVEEQRVIEAQIRIRQQEVQDEEERMKNKKNQEIDNNNNIHNNTNNNNNINNNNKSPSIRKLTPAEVEYCDFCTTSLSVPSFRCMTNGDEFVSSQPSCSASMHSRPSHSRHNRDDNINHLDLEDVMVMEAIWLSIQQEQGNGGYPGCTGSMLIDPYTGSMMGPPPHPYTCAVAALTEQNHLHPIPYSYPSSSSFDPIHIQRSGFISSSSMDMCSPSPSNWRDVSNGEDGDHWSDAAEAGTSYAGSDIVLDTGSVLQVPIPVPVMGIHEGFGGFEEQMMLSMRNNPPGLTWH